MNSCPKVVVIIVNYNQTEFTIKCIESLLASRYSNFDVLVIDNTSDPLKTEYLRSQIDKSVILYETERNLGYVGGVNYGLEKMLMLASIVKMVQTLEMDLLQLEYKKEWHLLHIFQML